MLLVRFGLKYTGNRYLAEGRGAEGCFLAVGGGAVDMYCFWRGGGDIAMNRAGWLKRRVERGV